jgi:hypothetical protein
MARTTGGSLLRVTSYRLLTYWHRSKPFLFSIPAVGSRSKGRTKSRAA